MTRNFTLLLLFALVLLGVKPARAQAAVQTMTEHPAPDQYKLSRDDFEDAYAFNDTARAIIRMRFAKRNLGLNITRFAAVPVPIIALAGRHKNPTVTTTSTTITINPNSYYYDSWVAPAAFSLLGVSLAGLILAGNHGRDKLYQEIRQYRATRRLPASVRPATFIPYLVQVQREANPRR